MAEPYCPNSYSESISIKEYQRKLYHGRDSKRLKEIIQVIHYSIKRIG